jgi:hypothetical protein
MVVMGSQFLHADFKVYGAIAEKWRQLNGVAGPLGPAISDEAAAAGGGRFNTFKNGFIYWSPRTGAHAIYGAIGEKWNQLGRERSFGYPITDEMPASGEGRYNDFENGGSIYWKPATGAHAVIGAIRQKWLSAGGAGGSLGYPVSDEVQGAVGRQSNFEHGAIVWNGQIAQLVSAKPKSHVLETLTDRCSGDVIIASRYSDDFGDALLSGVLLKRGGSGPQTASALKISGHTWIRWWCHSTIGNWADPGTWRISDLYLSGGCSFDETSGTVSDCQRKDTKISMTSSDRQGWTAERSRCESDGTKYIDASVGTNRLLQIRCWGN